MTYKEKLLDPRWQKKRLEILQQANFSCQLCNDIETTLHVHHLEYSKSGNPWDTPNDLLACYCAHCHSIVEYNKKYDFDIQMIHKRELESGNYHISVYYLNESNNHVIDFYKYETKISKLDYLSTMSMETFNTIHRRFNSIYELFPPKLINDGCI